MMPDPPPMIQCVRCVTCLLTKKKFFCVTHVTLVGTWKVSSPPSISSYLEYVNVPCLHLMLPYPEGTCNTPSPILDPGSDKTQPRQEKKTPFLRVEFLLKTDGGHPEKTVVTLSTLGTPGNPFHSSTHR